MRSSKLDRCRAWVGVALLALLAAGCGSRAGGSSATPAGSPPAATASTLAEGLADGEHIDWVAKLPPPVGAPKVPGCATGALQARLDWDRSRGETAGVYKTTGTYKLTNPGAACALAQYGTISLFDAKLRPLQITQVGVSRPRQLPGSGTTPGVVQLGGGQSVQASVSWQNWCARFPNFVTLRVALDPGGTVSATQKAHAPSCTDPKAPSGIRLGPFTPPSPAPPLSASLTLPDTVKAGQPLRYAVELRNDALRPVTLRPCPTFAETLQSSVATFERRYVLRCEPVPGPIQPLASVSFDMVFDVPSTLPPGQYRVGWSIVPAGWQVELPVEAEAVTVTR